MAFPSYSTGTVSIAANATSVVGVGSNWSGQNAIAGDVLVVGADSVIISDVTDALHLVIDAWPFAAVTAASYKLYKVSPLRYAGGQAMAAVDTLVAALNTSGFYVFVGPTETVPDPSLGDDEQYALQATTGKLWQKTGGTWNFIGTQKGFSLPVPWNSATAYIAFDTVSLGGTSYVCILANTNQTPPNATYWTVLAAKGDAATVAVGAVTTGVGGSPAAVTNSGTSGAAVLNFTIPVAQGYGGTSTTSLAIANAVTRVFTTQAGLGYNGSRVRAASASAPTNYMEGVCTYSGTTLTMTVDSIGGSGTKIDWVLSIAGQPGLAGGGALLAANNLADVANAATARGNLGAAASATTISGSGLITGGGDLSANRTVTVTAAAKTDQQTGTSAALAVTPLHQQDHPSAAKASGNFVGTSAATNEAYNMSAARTGAGLYTISFPTHFSNNLYRVSITPMASGGAPLVGNVISKSIGSMNIQIFNLSPANVDPTSFDVICFGAQ
jgi:hypothetical protein